MDEFIIDGLAQGRSEKDILRSLSSHVRRKLHTLHDAVDAKLSKTDCFMLASLRGQHIFLNDDQVAQSNAQIGAGLESFEDQVRLLETIAGISRQLACDIVIEIGGDRHHCVRQLQSIQFLMWADAWQLRKCRQKTQSPLVARKSAPTYHAG